jgi:zinc and cadmium transporter
MNSFFILTIAVVSGSLISLIGGLYLLYGKHGVKTLQRISVPFAAGALLAAAFLDLLPESIEKWQVEPALTTVMVGIVLFFILERSLSWFHHHHEDNGAHVHGRRTSSLIVVGNTLHNFIDGLALGAAFLINPAAGVVATIAVAAHEIPREIGDFGLLLSKGVARARVLWLHILGTAATLVGAIIVYMVGGTMLSVEAVLLALTTGFFIYIAASDIIPTIHAEPRRSIAMLQSIVLVLGIVFVAIAQQLAHSFIEH